MAVSWIKLNESKKNKKKQRELKEKARLSIWSAHSLWMEVHLSSRINKITL